MDEIQEVIKVTKYATRADMGAAAAVVVAQKIRQLLKEQESVNIVFAAAPSQNEFLASFQLHNIEWDRINAFHMDEYVGLSANAPQGFGTFLKERLFSKVPFRSVHYLNGNAPDLDAECSRYTQLLNKYPVDIVCLGIGENGHLAFNDPPVADFEDPKTVKVVELDNICRQQQVNDGCFKLLEQVPEKALTLTIPALIRGKYLYCIVPSALKAQAIYNTFYKEVGVLYPSTILRTHPNVSLFLDWQSSKMLKGAPFL
ncbi:MAG: glucosamine-6-phosphate deaminase [Niabella sp.]